MITTDFKTGDLIKVFQKIKEGKRDRTISFEGKVIKKRGKGENRMFTLRQTLDSVDVDRIIPVALPTLLDIKVLDKAGKQRGTLSKIKDFKKDL